jgi:hypothetical protein
LSLDRSHRLSAILSAIAVTLVITIFACPGRHSSSFSPSTLVSIAVTPTNPTIALGTTRQFTATGMFSDGTTLDVTALAAWESSAVLAGDISNASGSQGLATGLGTGSTTIRASYSGMSGSTTLTVSSAALVSIEVTPTNPRIALGTSRQFSATGIFSDGTTQDLTGQVAWETSVASAATISNDPSSHGIADAVGLGDTAISATFSGVSGSTTLTVSAAVLVSLAVTPTNPAIALGTSEQLAATGVFSDGTAQDLTTQSDWSSSAAAASVSNAAGSRGLANGVAVGSTTVSATHSGITGSTTLTVSIAALASISVTPTNPTIAMGTSQAFAATGTFTDGSVQDLSNEVTWASSTDSVSSVSNVAGSKGIASAIGTGDTTISASYSGIVGSTKLSVSTATLVSIDITPSHPSVALGTRQPLVATGTYTDTSTQDITSDVTWSSSDPSVAVVSNAEGSRGLATSIGIGNTTVSAAVEGVTGSTSFTVSSAALVAIAVSPDATALAKGTTQGFTALGLLSDGTREELTEQVTWSSSDDSVATVSNAAGSRGLVTGLGIGSTSISASLSGVSGSTALDVSGAMLVSIDVSPFLQSMAKGTQVQFSAMGNYSDLSTQDLTAQVTWSTSDAAVAAVSNADGSRGLATGLGVGSTTLSAGIEGVLGTTNFDVTAAVLEEIRVAPADSSVRIGMGCAFHATGVFSDATTQDLTALVTWSSSDGAVATISNAAGGEGLATCVGGGSATISATHSGKIGTTSLTVSTATLASISISPSDPLLPSGYWMPFQAVGLYSDGSSTNLTLQAVWSSSDMNTATISNSVGSEGRATGVTVGTTTLKATLAGVSATTVLTVTNETLNSITVAPSSVTLALRGTQQMIATGIFSGGTTMDVTNQVRWSVVPRSVATVGNATNRGLVTTRRIGSATIKASRGNRNGTASVSVQ